MKLNQLFSNDQEDIQENPTIIERPVQLLDLFPTLVHLTDLGPPIKNCNKSLVIYKMFLVWINHSINEKQQCLGSQKHFK